MLDQLINSLKSEVGGQLTNQVNLPAGHLDQVFSILGDVTKKEVTGHLLGGNLSDVMNLFSDKPNNSGADTLQSNINTGLISGLTSKLGLTADKAASIASVVLPGLIKLITHKNNSTPEDDASPLHEIFGTGGNVGAIANAAKSILGKFLK